LVLEAKFKAPRQLETECKRLLSRRCVQGEWYARDVAMSLLRMLTQGKKLREIQRRQRHPLALNETAALHTRLEEDLAAFHNNPPAVPAATADDSSTWALIGSLTYMDKMMSRWTLALLEGPFKAFVEAYTVGKTFRRTIDFESAPEIGSLRDYVLWFLRERPERNIPDVTIDSTGLEPLIAEWNSFDRQVRLAADLIHETWLRDENT
jgi:hypothetical protein